MILLRLILFQNLHCKKLYIFTILLLFSFKLFGFEYRIDGQIFLPEGWSNTIYLSAINSFDERNTASEDFLVNTAIIDSQGRFSLIGKNLPESNRLYRLHVCKSGDPVSTIIIGGNEENYIHFIMNNSSQLIGDPDSMLLFLSYKFSNEENIILNKLEQQIQFWKTSQKSNSLRSREYNHVELEKYLKTFADTCNYSLLKLLAIDALDFETDYELNRQFYQDIKKQLAKQDTGSPYYQNYDQQLAFMDYKSSSTSSILNYWWMIILAIVGFYFLKKYRLFPFSKKSLKRSLHDLSLQERKIFDLLTDGFSNKEISSQMHIEISTVKSHVYNIYSKLGIKSRKEALRFKDKN